MSVNTKRVSYVKYLSHGISAELLGARPDVRLGRGESGSADVEACTEAGVLVVNQAGGNRQSGFAPGQPERQLAGE